MIDIKRNYYLNIGICFCLLFINIILLIKYSIDYQFKISNNFISRKAKYFFVNNNDIKKRIVDACFSNEGIVLYNKIYENYKFTIISTIFNENVEIPKISEGRYFNSTDFFSNKKYVVIGKTILNSELIMAEGEKKYFLFGDEKIEIIGILDYGDNSILSQTIFLNMDSIINYLPNVFSIDGKTPKINSALHTLKSEFEVNEMEYQIPDLNKIMDIRSQSLFILKITLILLCLILLSLSIFEFHYRSSEFIIMKIIGFSFSKILIHNFIKTTKLLLNILLIYLPCELILFLYLFKKDLSLSFIQSIYAVAIFIVLLYMETFIFSMLYFKKDNLTYSKEGM